MKAPPPGLAALAPAHKHAAPQPCRARGAGGLTPGAARSHCWGGKWSSLVAAASCGAKRGRMVWIDLFAVRQFPGNEADLDVRGVVRPPRPPARVRTGAYRPSLAECRIRGFED